MTKFCSAFHEILAFRQNRERQQEVGQCDLILLYMFFILVILKIKVHLMLYTKFQPTISSGSGEKLILVVKLFLATVAIFDSGP